MDYRFDLVTMNEEKLEGMFKKDWSNFEIMGVEAFLDDWFEEYEGYKAVCENVLQLAYTSSSSYAMLNECGNFEYNGLIVSHFAMTESNMLVMVCHDEDQEYSYYWMN